VMDLASHYPGQKITFGTGARARRDGQRDSTQGNRRDLVHFNLGRRGDGDSSSVMGRHFVPNALSAWHRLPLRVEVQQIKAALENFQPFPMRMEGVPLKEEPS